MGVINIGLPQIVLSCKEKSIVPPLSDYVWQKVEVLAVFSETAKKDNMLL